MNSYLDTNILIDFIAERGEFYKDAKNIFEFAEQNIIQKSLKSHHKNFEDALQIFCAHKIENLDAIITRNIRDFSTSEINVLAPDEVLHFISKKNKNK